VNVENWLHGMGMRQYAAAFRDNGIGADVLADLTEADLEKLGLNLGDRKRLLKAIAALGAEPAPPETPTAPLVPTPTPPEAERRQLTVTFVDLVGSTKLSTRLDPEDMRELMRSYQNTVAGEIARFEGHVAQFLGDGVLAYFGWPRAHEDEAERAVRAALAVTAAASRIKTPTDAALQTRIGIATGMVVVGDLIGEGSGQRHAVVGETPNLAARLQGIAEPGTVVIADSTRHLLGDLFLLRELGPQQFKGLAMPTQAYAVLGERALESRFAARHAGGVTPLVGRDQELALLIERWQQAKAGEGQVVLLSGEAGIGKSRIAEAVVEAVRGEAYYLLRYQCSPYHADSALYPAIQQISHAAGFSATDSPEQRLDRLEALLAEGSAEPRTVAPLFAALLGIDGTARYGASTPTPQQRRTRTLAALVDQLSGLARKKPVLWVFEDVHWVDPTTMELIELTLDRVQGMQVLALITMRPSFVAPFANHPVVTRLALNRLGRTATQAIVDRITHGKHLPEALLDEIAARTDGVPLFVEEMTKAVIESGVLREDDNAYNLDGPLSSLAIPTTLHDSLMARLDRLQPLKEVAQTAAVIGRSFDHRSIAALSGLPEAELTDAMQRLVEAELIFRRGNPPEATYLFKHALVRDAAYESLLRARRISLHGRLLEILEVGGDAAPEVMAQHAEAAGMPERALDYWEQAGKQAQARPAYKEAISGFGNAIRVCRALGDELQWKAREQGLQMQVWQAQIANHGYSAPATLRTLERALALAEEIGNVPLQIPALYGQWVAHYVAGRRADELAQRFAALVDMESESGPRLIGLRILGLERFHEGRFTDSLVFMEKALDSYDPIAHRDLALRFGVDARAAAEGYRTWNIWHLGFPDQAVRASESNLRWARKVDHVNTTGHVLCIGLLTNIWLRQPERVERAARETLRLAEERSLALWHAWALICLGWALSQQEAARGLDSIETGLREAHEIGAGRFDPLYQCLAADAYSRAGRHDEARASIAKAFTAQAAGPDMAHAADLHRTRAAVLLRADASQGAAAEADLRRALEIATQQESPSLQLRAARDLASLLAERGERQQAADLLAPIYAWFTEGFETLDLIEAKALLETLR
jgi:class 3 adenylate cyclase/predicted ATPase